MTRSMTQPSLRERPDAVEGKPGGPKSVRIDLGLKLGTDQTRTLDFVDPIGPVPIRLSGTKGFEDGKARRNLATTHRNEVRPNIMMTPAIPATTEVMGSIVSGPR
jgi:hypothetical protein